MSNPQFLSDNQIVDNFCASIQKHIRRWPNHNTCVWKIQEEFNTLLTDLEHYNRNRKAIWEAKRVYQQLAA